MNTPCDRYNFTSRLPRRFVRLILFATLFLSAFYAWSQSYQFLSVPNRRGVSYYPYAGLIQGSNGDLYGNTSSWNSKTQHGQVFEVSPAGKAKVLYTFTGMPDGDHSTDSVVEDSEGNLYGTTRYGGLFNLGSVFKIDQTGHEIWLYSFRGGSDGAIPRFPLVQDSQGNFYGTTVEGGNGCSSGCGTVFKIDPAGNESIFYAFKNAPDASEPLSGLLLDAAGNLYGTAAGGANNNGVVFKLDPSGKETVLFNFDRDVNGSYPVGPLIQDAAGSLYGSTNTGMGSGCGGGGCGTVFKLDASQHETNLYAFTGGDDGGSPWAGVVQDAAGNLYGTTGKGGLPDCLGGCGTVFRLAADGQFAVLHQFSGEDGSQPQSPLLLDGASLYGTTPYGGYKGLPRGCGGLGCGVLFHITR